VKNKEYPSEEYCLLKSLEPLLNYKKSTRYPLGIGDDAAIRTSPGNETLIITADTMVERVHFSLDYMTLKEVGFKAMCVNLSDCAAMGARPDGALAQIVFPQNLSGRGTAAAMKSLYEGFYEACTAWKYPIIGGNLSKGPCWIIDITLMGSMEKATQPIRRTGLQSGDNLWVTGSPGSSAAGLAALKKWGKKVKRIKAYKNLVQTHVRPIPRLEIGLHVAQNPQVHAMIDVSDGIAKECRTLSYDNRLGILLESGLITFTPQMIALGEELRCSCRDWFLYGGEDYELLFGASPDFNPGPIIHKHGVGLTKIGAVSGRVKGVFFKHNNDTMKPVEARRGWDHLRKND